MGAIFDSLRLIRVINCTLAFLGVLLGAHMTRQWDWYYPVLSAGVAAFFVCAAGNIVNDILDIPIDRINRPNRVLVRQMLSIRTAWWLAAFSTATALLLAFTVNTAVVLSAVVTVGLLAAYNFGCKRIPFFGNAIIAFLGAMTFLTGAWAVKADVFSNPSGALAPAVFAFVLHLIREMLKDVEDIDGDRRAHVKTLPQIIGEKQTIRLAFGLFILLILLTITPIILHWYGPAYTWLTIFGIDLPLLFVMIRLLRQPDRDRVWAGSLSLKVGMGMGMLALAFA